MGSATVLVAHPSEDVRRFVAAELAEAGFAVTAVADGEAALRELFGPGVPLELESAEELPTDFDLAVVEQDLCVGDVPLFQHVRLHSRSTRLLVLTEAPDPERIASMLVCRVDDLLVTDRPRSIAERVGQCLRRPAALPDFEVVSAAPHWVEVAFPATAHHFKVLRHFLDGLELALPGGERTKIIFALAELVRCAVEQDGAAEGTLRVSCYRFDSARVIRVAASEHVSFVVPEPEDEDRAEPTDDEVTAVFLEGAGNPWIDVVGRYADHFIASGSGNEVMLVRKLEPADD